MTQTDPVDPLFSTSLSLQIVACRLGHNLNLSRSVQITSFCIDSRLAAEGSLFFALPGKRQDGHDFLEEVAQKGARAAVVRADYEGPSYGLVLLRTDSPLLALQHLAQEKILEKAPKIIAITGSVGKTTTKEFLATLLACRYRVGKTPGNANSQAGLPLAILNWNEEVDLLILEMGMSKPGEIARLIEIAPPDIALITKIGTAHVSNFSDGIEGVRREKGSILSHPKTALGLIPDGEFFPDFSCPQVSVGREASSFYWYEATPFGLRIWEKGVYPNDSMMPTTNFSSHLGIASPHLQLSLQAHHLQENFVMAASCARILGLTWEEIQEGAKLLIPFRNRFERVEKEGVIWINDAYNANPESMKAALLNLPAASRKIAVLGGMVDLGELSCSAHRAIGEYALLAVDQVLCIGEGAQWIVERFLEVGREARFFTSFSDLKAACQALVEPGDLVLIKGSNFNSLWKLLE